MGTAVRDNSGIELYLKQISEAPLLSAEQERELAMAVQRSQTLCEVSPRTTAELMEKEAADSAAVKARERLVECNLRLVVNIAKRFARRGMPLADLIEEGNLGLIRAVEGYDPDQNTRFSTYASWWIKQAIKRSLINSRQAVHIPAYMVEMIARWKEAKAAFAEEQGRAPSLQELAEYMKVPERKVNMIRRAFKALTSSKQSTSEDFELPLSETLTDDRTPSPDEWLFSETENATVLRLLDEIDEREAQILRLRFGLEDGEVMTLKDIGAKIGLTRERVRQIERDALRKLQTLLEGE